MHYTTLLRATALAFATRTDRDHASSHAPLIVDTDQNGGLCGGFWDNLKGRANCAGKSNGGCVVQGTRKVIEFTVPLGCQPKEVLGVLWTATKPRVEGVKCSERDFEWETKGKGGK
ncbi:hypothetical protein F4818DRAFT_442501 [Hypoxylon cercidicola]|nr:hypothetical protein F4818DRAFT_442501 [Hypoxylon cercidicola]